MFAMPATTSKPYDDRKKRTEQRNKDICEFINKMYHGKPRRRFDDCIKAAADKFYLSELMVQRIYEEG